MLIQIPNPTSETPSRVVLRALRRLDDGLSEALVVSEFTLTAGLWSLDVPITMPSSVYSYVARVIWADDSYDDIGGTVTGLGIPIVSKYINYDRFVRRWGLKNLSIVSNKDNPKVLSVDAIQDAFRYADDEVDAALAPTYKIPLDFTPNNGVVLPIVESWTSIIAFNYLYEARGWEEKVKASNRLSVLIRETYQTMSLYRIGLRSLKVVAGTSFGISVVKSRRQELLATGITVIPSVSYPVFVP